MSIYTEISARVTEGRLYPLQPFMPPEAGVPERRMFLSEEIRSLIVGPWHDTEWQLRCGALYADLDKFVQGGLITVAEHPFRRGKTAYMKQLSKWSEEVWEIRSRDPQPGIRVMGRFADTDVFIALSWSYRSSLGGPNARPWRDAIVGCKTQWRNLFPAYEPISAGDDDAYPNTYISANTYLI